MNKRENKSLSYVDVHASKDPTEVREQLLGSLETAFQAEAVVSTKALR